MFTKSITLEAAINYAQAGFASFALAPRSKRPLTKHGFKDASLDLTILCSQFAIHPDANVGLKTGGGFLVIDVDGLIGLKNLTTHENRNCKLPRKHVVKTTRGEHIYLAYDPSINIASNTALLGEGIDIRANGGYVVAPPSIHPEGGRYKWSTPCLSYNGELAMAPQWLIQKLCNLSNYNSYFSIPQDTLARMLQMGVGEGERNTTATRIIGTLLRHRVNAHLSLELLRCANETCFDPPLDNQEIERIANSIASRELRQRELYHD